MRSAGKIIDIFCGAGGFSLGAHLAGFETVAAVDIDKNLTSLFETNFPGSPLLLSDVSTITAETILAKAGVAANEIVGIIGGPPCQGFSLMGKRQVDDPRNALVGHYFRIVKAISPAFFVMENVPGLLLNGPRHLLNEALATMKGYEIVGPIIVDARDYGAATHRKRVVVIGYKPTRVDPIKVDELLKLKRPCLNTVKDAIFDLPEPTAEGIANYRKISKLSAYASRARKEEFGLGSERLKQLLKDGRVTGLQKTAHTPSVVKRFRSVVAGNSDPISKCPRLVWDAGAPTLRAGTGPDKGSFQAIRPIHPQYPRVITVREAARIQGFPDWFEFHETKWHSFRMIGNSVSPHMAETLMNLIKSKLRNSLNIERDENADKTY